MRNHVRRHRPHVLGVKISDCMPAQFVAAGGGLTPKQVQEWYERVNQIRARRLSKPGA